MKFIQQIVKPVGQQRASIKMVKFDSAAHDKESKHKKKKKKRERSSSSSSSPKERSKDRKKKKKKKRHHKSDSHESKSSEETTPVSKVSGLRPELLELGKDNFTQHKYKGRTPSILIISKMDDPPMHVRRKDSLVHTKSVGGANLLLVQERPSFLEPVSSMGSMNSRAESKNTSSGRRLSFVRKNSKVTKITLADHVNVH